MSCATAAALQMLVGLVVSKIRLQTARLLRPQYLLQVLHLTEAQRRFWLFIRMQSDLEAPRMMIRCGWTQYAPHSPPSWSVLLGTTSSACWWSWLPTGAMSLRSPDP